MVTLNRTGTEVEASVESGRRFDAFKMPEARKDDGVSPEQRLAEHKASKASIGPDPNTVRLTYRGKLGDERPLVRAMYDIANKPKRRRRRKGKNA
jgi:hypothetical protein